MSGGFSGLFLLMLLSAMPFQRLLSSLVFGSTTLPIAASAFREFSKIRHDVLVVHFDCVLIVCVSFRIPDERCAEILLTEYLIHEHSSRSHLVVVDADKK